MRLVGFRIAPTPFGLFRRHKWYCDSLDCYIHMRLPGTNCVGVLIVRDDEGKVRHLGFPSEKDALLEYCKRADRKYPRGYGDCGFVLVLAHKTPNNSIPVLHANNVRWKGLFPRY